MSRDLQAPPWSFVASIGADLTGTDNVRGTELDHEADLITQLTGAVTVGANTLRFQSTLHYRATLYDYIVANEQDRVSHYAFGTGHLIFVPDTFFFDFSAGADELLRGGAPTLNSALQGDTTQYYSVSGSPYFRARAGDLGFGEIRYSVSRIWFQRNTDAILTPGGGLAPLTDATQQYARADLKMPGTLASRLLSDIYISGSSTESSSETGTLRKAAGGFIGEYQVTPLLSFIGAAGYETLDNSRSVALTDNGETWDVGGRLRFDENSYLVLLYGKRDLETDLTGEFNLALSERTGIYASYTSNITTSQQTLADSSTGARLGPQGPSAGITPTQNPTLSILNEMITQTQAAQDRSALASGFPLSAANSYAGYGDGFFRQRAAVGTVYTQLGANTVSLSAFHVERTPLTVSTFPSTITTGAQGAWHRAFRPNLTGYAAASSYDEDLHDSEMINLALGLNYGFGSSVNLGLRYDFISRDTSLTGGNSVANALTISLSKRFE